MVTDLHLFVGVVPIDNVEFSVIVSLSISNENHIVIFVDIGEGDIKSDSQVLLEHRRDASWGNAHDFQSNF